MIAKNENRFSIYINGVESAYMELDVEEGYLHGIQTFPAFRKLGFCRKLVEFAMTECWELTTFTNSQILEDLLKKLGWTEEPSVMKEFKKMIWERR